MILSNPAQARAISFSVQIVLGYYCPKGLEKRVSADGEC